MILPMNQNTLKIVELSPFRVLEIHSHLTPESMHLRAHQDIRVLLESRDGETVELRLQMDDRTKISQSTDIPQELP